MNTEYDVIVVGAGPAGSTVANILASRGRRVLIIERSIFPRYQIGESLIPATIHGVCKILGVDKELEQAKFIKKNGASFRWGKSPDIWTMRFTHSSWLEQNNANYAYQVERQKFDQILLNKAIEKGASFIEDVSVIDMDHESDCVVVKTKHPDYKSITCRYLVDASGNTSKLYRKVGSRVQSDFFKNFALFSYFSDVSFRPEPYSGNIICEAIEDGWVWFIPLRNNAKEKLASVGVVLSDNRKNDIRYKEQLYRETLEKTSHIKKLLDKGKRSCEEPYDKLYVRKDWSYTTTSFYKNNVALVGDAACFLDPILSTGVHFATYGGLLLGRSLNSCFEDPDNKLEYMSEFETRYRMEYQIFYKYLLAFYDMGNDEKSYYWQARKILNTEEKESQAFSRLLGGGITNPNIFLGNLEGIGDELQDYAFKLRDADMSKSSNSITQQLAEGIMKFGCSKDNFKKYIDTLAGREDLVQSKKEIDDLLDQASELHGFVPSSDGLSWQKIS